MGKNREKPRKEKERDRHGKEEEEPKGKEGKEDKRDKKWKNPDRQTKMFYKKKRDRYVLFDEY